MWEVLNSGGHPYDHVKDIWDMWDMAKLFVQNPMNAPRIPKVLELRMHIGVLNDLALILSTSWSKLRQDRLTFLFYSEKIAEIYHYIGKSEDESMNFDLKTQRGEQKFEVFFLNFRIYPVFTLLLISRP